MDYVLLNALAISAMAVFGIWVFQYGAKKQKEAERKKHEQAEKFLNECPSAQSYSLYANSGLEGCESRANL